MKTNYYGIHTLYDRGCAPRRERNSPSKRMTAPDPLSNTSATVASEVSVPENVFYPFISYFNNAQYLRHTHTLYKIPKLAL